MKAEHRQPIAASESLWKDDPWKRRLACEELSNDKYARCQETSFIIDSSDTHPLQSTFLHAYHMLPKFVVFNDACRSFAVEAHLRCGAEMQLTAYSCQQLLTCTKHCGIACNTCIGCLACCFFWEVPHHDALLERSNAAWMWPSRVQRWGEAKQPGPYRIRSHGAVSCWPTNYVISPNTEAF